MRTANCPASARSRGRAHGLELSAWISCTSTRLVPTYPQTPSLHLRRTCSPGLVSYDELPLVRAFAEGFPYCRDVICEIAFLNFAVGPEHVHQLILFKHLALMLDQDEQRIESLRCQRHDLP